MDNINEYEEELTEVEIIKLRYYVGLVYRTTEKMDTLFIDDYKIEKLDSKRLYVDDNSFFAVFNTKFDTKEESREAFSEIKDSFGDVGKSIYDYNFDKDENELTVVIEPYVA